MNIEQIEERFSQVAKEYDEQRKLFIPCFDDYLQLFKIWSYLCRKVENKHW